MQTIRRRLFLFAAISTVGMAAFFWCFLQKRLVLLWTPAILGILSLGALMWEYRKYKTAILIKENKIMHIQTATIEEATTEGATKVLTSGGIEVYISCFGILLDTKVIRFNMDGIHLTSVEIGHESINLSYGREKKSQTVCILHGAVGSEELENLMKRFRYETGIVPALKDE